MALLDTNAQVWGVLILFRRSRLFLWRFFWCRELSRSRVWTPPALGAPPVSKQPFGGVSFCIPNPCPVRGGKREGPRVHVCPGLSILTQNVWSFVPASTTSGNEGQEFSPGGFSFSGVYEKDVYGLSCAHFPLWVLLGVAFIIWGHWVGPGFTSSWPLGAVLLIQRPSLVGTWVTPASPAWTCPHAAGFNPLSP